MKKTKAVPKYNFKKIERKWQKHWDQDKTFQLDMNKARKPFYNLMMFPYPSAEGLHVGSAYTFSGVDTYGRFKQLQGYDVFEPIGLDGFGIHSENFAMKIGQHIKDVSKRTEKTYYRQLRQIGNMHDWSRTVETYKPEYYKWTQWLFLQMYKKGLAYQKVAKVNWCPSCKTVLSDEQVIQSQCERCDAFVEKKELKQWFFKITKYANQLLKNLDWIDWPEDVKTNQRNWIGRSEGANIFFKVNKMDYRLEVFTTRPDTLFGATYMVLAPEHELIESSKDKIENWKQVKAYITKSINKTEQDRKNDEKEKTGVELKGLSVINPATGKKIPVWVADYVLAGYGTGAIMAVPAHDERDFEFAKKFDIPIVEVVTPIFGKELEETDKVVERQTISAIIKRKKDGKFLFLELKNEYAGKIVSVIGGIEKGESVEKAAKREVFEETGYKPKFMHAIGGKIESHFFAEHKNSWRKRIDQPVYMEVENEKQGKVSEEERKKHNILWLSKKEALEKMAFSDDTLRFERFLGSAKAFSGEGRNVNSGFLNDMRTEDAKKEMVAWLVKNNLGKKSIDYKLRDWCISRQRYWGPPIPIVWCKHCALRQKPKNKKTKVLIIHGFEADGGSNWFPWMKKHLEELGCEVFAPTISTSMNPTLSSWMKELKPYLERLDEDSVVIGHSLGSTAALQLLGKNNKKVSKVFLVASAIGNPKRDWEQMKKKWVGSDIDSLKKFWQQKIDWKKADENIEKKFIIFSKDDPAIDPEHYKVARLSNLQVEKWQGHRHFSVLKDEKLRDFITEKILEDVQPVPVSVPENDLPVKLPPMEDFLPEGKGKGPLAKNEKFVNTKCPTCGADAERETDVSDPFVDSSWYFLRYPSTEIDDKPFDKKRTKKWLPVDSYIGGKEHTVLHLLYSRFVTMVLNDLGYIDFDEPYKRFFGHGLITKDGAKMSKSKGNVVNPDDMIVKYGADTMRLYLRFLGDFSQGGDWRDSGMEGMAKFVKRMWTTFFQLDGKGSGVKNDSMIDKTLKVVGEDIDKLSFNTAVARIMEFVNWIRENVQDFDEKQARKIKETIAFLLAPMAPHIAEEFWAILGNKESIFTHKWPKYRSSKIIDEEIELIVQVNGKLRDKILVSKDISGEDAERLALESKKVKSFTEGKEIKRVIYVTGKLVSIVV